jgi:hypothetical protein
MCEKINVSWIYPPEVFRTLNRTECRVLRGQVLNLIARRQVTLNQCVGLIDTLGATSCIYGNVAKYYLF